MILPVVFLATAVQSLITYVEFCTFSANTSCAESPYCFNETVGEVLGFTCDRYLVFLQEWQLPELESWDTCMTLSHYNEDTEDYDMTVKCNDDGRSPCDDNLICAEICYFSNTSTCDGFCYEQNVTIPGMNDCDDYRANYTEMDVGFPGFTNFGECFTYDDTFDVRITGCPNFSLSSTNDMNIGLIVGLTCAVLLIIIAILVLVNYRKSKKKAENLQKTIEAV